MNTRYRAILLCLSRLSRKSNKGFAMAFVLTAGVLMTLTATVMLVRSSSEKEKVFVQQNTAKGIAKADVGVIRIAQFLNQEQHQELIKKELDDWPSVATQIVNKYKPSGSNDNNNNNSGGNELEAKGCDGSQIPGEWGLGGDNSDLDEPIALFDKDEFNDMVNKLRNKEWIEINENDPSAGEFRLTDYKLLPEDVDPADATMVELEIQARGLDQDNSSDSDLKFNNSVRKISVKLPILEKSQEATEGDDTETALIPGFWVSDENGEKDEQNSKLSAGKINAITWIDCSQKDEWNDNDSYVNDDKLASSDLKAIGVKQIKDELPPVPDRPTSGLYELGSFKPSNCYITLPRIEGNGAGGENIENCNYIYEIDKDPSPSGYDQPVGNIYYYLFEDSGDAIVLSNSQIRINPPENSKVVIFIKGKTTLTGTGKDHGAPASCQGTSEPVTTYIGDPDDPTKLEIYVEPNGDEDFVDISDTVMISGLLHAPESTLKISQAEVRGMAWVQATDGGSSSGCQIAINQMDVGPTLLMGGSPQGQPQNFTVVGQVSSYRSVEVEEEE